MNTEQLLQDLLKAQAQGKVNQKNFEESLHNIINRHVHMQIQQVMENEYHVFMMNTFRENFSKLMVAENIELDTVTSEDVVRDDNGEVVLIGEKAVSYNEYNDRQWTYRYFGIVKRVVPRYTVVREKYAKRMAYHIATTGYQYFSQQRQKEEKEKAEIMRKYQEELKKIEREKESHKNPVTPDEASKPVPSKKANLKVLKGGKG